MASTGTVDVTKPIDEAFVASIGNPPTGENGKKLVKKQLGNVAALCTELAAEQLCNTQGRVYANPQSVSG